jgi:hypothetical protein
MSLFFDFDSNLPKFLAIVDLFKQLNRHFHGRKKKNKKGRALKKRMKK